MPFISNFKKVEDVADKFGIKIGMGHFIDTLDIKVSESKLAEIRNAFDDSMNFVNEVAVCEMIIRPILNVVDNQYERLHIWPRVEYNVDPANDLVGRPDYLIAARTPSGRMTLPPLCIMEAKQEKIEEDWAQALAEMYAASTQGAETSYGVVTTGKAWEFGKLENGKVFIRDPNQISATMSLQTVLNTLNWLFNETNNIIQDSTTT
ncbi:hypothetical protein QUF72_05780 [Desulfobacterales bacterium HSG2]|nr:hypothetical protein [Desulfobacterales bacterium HSG2]